MKAPLPSRGFTINPAGRFEVRRFEPDFPEGDASTVVVEDRTRSILATNDSPDVPFDRSINPYRGCEHGCAYCFARPSHAYLGWSPGRDFETKILAKPRAADLLRRELAKPGYRCEPIALGTNTDPYQPLERKMRITRSVLEVLVEHRHPFSIVTKSAGVLRDLDLIAPMAREGMAKVFLSITTLDPELARRLEPRASAPRRRLEALRGLGSEGVPTGVLASPMIPGLNDHELERILEASAAAGASSAGYLLVRLPNEMKTLFVEWLGLHYPTKAGKVLALIREMRGGELNDPRFGERMRGRGPYADLLARRFEVACRRYGLRGREASLDTSRFRVPEPVGRQRRLFG
ncbi:MAG TPA: PA0069 family radical SAM protein [Candidatus Polarisedimenticolaceae bacterium]